MKILIVDDEPLVRRSLRRALEHKGFAVVEADDGKKGLDLFRKEKPQVVFLDVLMPGLSGPQVLTELSQNEKDQAKIILMSAYTGEYDLASAQSLGAHLFMPKPFEDVFAVVDKMRALLEGS